MNLDAIKRYAPLAWWLSVTLLCATLASCGWQLRGSASAALAFDSIYLQGADNDPPFRIFLKDALQRSEVTVAPVKEQAQVVLTLSQVRLDRRVLTVSSDGSVEEYALFFAVNVGVESPAGETLLQRRPVEFSRDYTYDKNAALAKGGEEELLFREMRMNAVREILRRLQGLSMP